MLEVLATATDPEEAVRALRGRPEAAPFRTWIDLWEPRMVRVAASLVRRWGVARPPPIE